MFSRDLEMQHWTKIASLIFLVQGVFILSENGAFYEEFANILF